MIPGKGELKMIVHSVMSNKTKFSQHKRLKGSLNRYESTVEPAYFEAIRIKKDFKLSEIQIIRIHRGKEF